MQIHILDSQYAGDPEALAMIQAFYSRSNESVVSRVNRLGTDLTSVKKALRKYFVGYGHASIGDCGTVTVFIEDVSILAAKALQENPLYNGQECSTRYIDLSGSLYKPTTKSLWWQKEYVNLLPELIAGIREQHPFTTTQALDLNNPKHTASGSEYSTWQNATAARAFDIARGWIPCNTLTNLSWSFSLRKASEFTTQLMGHPLQEVQDIAVALRNKLHECYAHGIPSILEKDIDVASWLSSDDSHHAWYCDDTLPVECMASVEVHNVYKCFTQEQLAFINARPRHAILPHGMESLATCTIQGKIDYGTWRDMQRHRRQTGLPPAVRATEIHPWYYEQVQQYLPAMQSADFIASSMNALQKQSIKNINSDTESTQYDCPLGTLVPYCYKMGLSQALYFAELRSGNTVHAILRPIAQQVADSIRNYGIRVDNDTQPTRFDIKRGTQTIYEKEQS